MGERRARVDLERLAELVAERVADRVLERLGIRETIAAGKPAGAERTALWPEQENGSMDPTHTATGGGSSSSTETGDELLTLLRAKAKREPRSPPRARGSRGCR